jgi:DNA-binding LytR/AlgR family response regulator
MSPTAIIVDDEATLIDYLTSKLAKLWPELDVVGTAQNGRQALALAAETQPDIAFLDIHMPGLSGLAVAQALPEETKVVFITAHDEHAIAAFEQAAVDYVLKPVTDARLAQTIERLTAEPNTGHRQLLALIEELKPSKTYLKWIRAGYDETTELVPTDDVVYFKAEQKYTSVITKDTEYVVRRTIKQLEHDLDPDEFWRVHRSIIVRIDQIDSARRDLRGRYTITLRDRPESIRTSQSYGHLFKQM